jgi:hypothetical protein
LDLADFYNDAVNEPDFKPPCPPSSTSHPRLLAPPPPRQINTQVSQVLDLADFYNDAVNEPDFNFKEDYKCWTSVSDTCCTHTQT